MPYYHICVLDQQTVRIKTRKPNSTEENSLLGRFRQDKITNEIQNIIKSPAQLIDGQIQRVGEALFDALFDDDLRENFLSYKNKTNEIQVILEINEDAMPEVIAYPWEFMCLPERFNKGDIHFATDRRLSFSRCRYQLEQASRLPITLNQGQKLKIALAVSNPTTDPELNSVESHEVNKYLEGLNKQKVEYLFAMEMDHSNIVTRLEENQPDIFHFIGHGRLIERNGESVGQIAFVSDGKPDWKDGREFAQLFSGHTPKIVILQACETGRQSETNAFRSVVSCLMLQRVPVVIAMQFKVTNQTASIFVQEFYSKIVEGASVEMAVQKARSRLAIMRGLMRIDFAIPVIYMNAQDGYLFPQKHQPNQPFSSERTNMETEKILPFLKSSLDGFDEYTKSKKSEKDLIKFVKSWTKLINTIQFCKSIHDDCQNFQNMVLKHLNAIIDKKEDLTVKILNDEWVNVNKFYQSIEINLNQIANGEGKTIECETISIEIPSPILFNINFINLAYPRLIKNLSEFCTKYEELNRQNEACRIDDFQLNAKILKTKFNDVFTGADKMILNLLPILTYNHDQLSNPH